MQLDNLIRKNIKDLKPYQAARHNSNLKGILLDANENPYENLYNRYPDPYQNELKTTIARLKGLSKNQVFIGNGSDETLDLLIRAFCEPHEDNIIVLPPTYGMYKVLANINAVTCLEAPLNKDFSLNINRLLATVNPQTKMIFICSPNNPTGNLLSQQDIQTVLDNFEGIVVIDEAYIDFSNQQTAIALLDKYPNLFVNQTLSKAYAGAGLRLGMGFSSAALINVLNTIKPPYNINQPAQLKGIQLLEKQLEMKACIEAIKKEKARLFRLLNPLEIVIEIFPSDANFWLVRFKDANKIHALLLEMGIITRNRSTEMHCENTLRITVGTEEENNKLITCLTQINLTI